MNKKWYRKSVIKGILVLAAQISAVGLIISLFLFLCTSSVVSSGNIFETTEQHYEDTSRFAEQLGETSDYVLDYLDKRNQFETEGQYDPDKIVDIVAYGEDNIISGINESGLAYRLGDLVEWGRQYSWGDYNGYKARGIVVCKKSDGTYSYYYQEEFRQKVIEGDLNLYMGESSVPKFSPLEDEFFRELENGEFELDLFPKQLSVTYIESGQEDTDGQTDSQSETAGRSDLETQIETSLSESEKIAASGRLNLRDSDGNVLYVDCWVMDRSVTDLFQPIGADSILQAVENSPELNGQLSEMEDMLVSTFTDIYEAQKTYQTVEEEWGQGNSNFVYLFVDHTERKIYSNDKSYTEYMRAEEYISSIINEKNYKYVVINPVSKDCASNVKNIYNRHWIEMVESYQSLTKDYTFVAAVDTGYPVLDDSFSLAAKDYEQWAPYHGWSMGLTAVFAIILTAALVWLTIAAGRRETDEELHLNAFDGWKTELGAAAVLVPWLLITFAMMCTTVFWHVSTYRSYDVNYSMTWTSAISSNWSDILAISVYTVITISLFLIGYLSLVRRIKGGTLWKNSLLRMILSGISMFWGSRKLTARAVMATVGFILLHWFLILAIGERWTGDILFVLLLLLAAADVAAVYLAAKNMIGRQRIKEGVEEISSGNVNFKVRTDDLRGTEAEVAEQLNHIGDGLNQAVETAVKSERLKTDLITNVSHDIKTPLTSIINYVDLLKRENFDDPKIRGYLNILEEKSQRLKTLTEDVVEASKASSGNISLEYMNVNLVEMLNQTIGETSEKMENRNLTVISDFPEEPVIIRVDGRRMWRVLENIFNNAAKYAMPGTRVYADLHKVNGQAVFSLKNMSEQPLNIKAEELTERFIRGDVARSTEGSGLGLSIAKSLTTLQGGTFELYLDGDLFKVIITFDEKSETQ